VSEIERIQVGPRMSQAVVHGGLVFLAGQVDGDGPDVAGQTRNVLAKVDSLLQQAGSDRSRILSANVWLSDIGFFDAMNGIWERWIDPANPPARVTVEAKLAGPQFLVEIAVVASRQ
jgi:enamine deaminase RidA (YjgF/YER057c/UK114 family)